jgi:hypothetical protein
MLDVEMDAAKGWRKTLRARIYSDDAAMFESHLLHSFMAFCQPENPEEEFLLMENAFGIFEGPSSQKINLLTGKTEAIVYTEYQNFAPVSPRLIIILRSIMLPFPGDDCVHQDLRRRLMDAMRSAHLEPDKAGSILQDLPVRPCATVYEGPVINSPDSYSKNDRFNFQCFTLSSAHTKTINNLLLEEVCQTSSIVCNSPISLRASMENSLRLKLPV